MLFTQLDVVATKPLGAKLLMNHLNSRMRCRAHAACLWVGGNRPVTGRSPVRYPTATNGHCAEAPRPRATGPREKTPLKTLEKRVNKLFYNFFLGGLLFVYEAGGSDVTRGRSTPKNNNTHLRAQASALPWECV